MEEKNEIEMQGESSTSSNSSSIPPLIRRMSTAIKLEVKIKSGPVQIRDSNSIRKFMFKNWKPAWAELTSEKLFVYKDETKEKIKFEVPLLQSYVTYPLIGTQEERYSALFFHNNKGEEQYLKVESKDSAKEWITAIKMNSKMLDNNLMKELAFPKPEPTFEEQVLKMGWVREKSPVLYWRWRFLVLTDAAVYVYDKPPASSAQLGSYSIRYLLSETKQRELDPSDFPEAEEESIKNAFAILGTKESSFVATETKNEAKNWLNALKAMTLSSVRKTENFSFDVTRSDDKRSLKLHIQRNQGFILKSPEGNEIFNHPFGRFKQFKIEKKSLILDFGKFSDQLIELQTPDANRISIIISHLLETLIDSKRKESAPSP